MKNFSLLFLLLFCFGLVNRGFAIDPDREYIKTPDSVNWDYEQLIITTKDHFKLNSWIYQANMENDKDTVLVLAYPDAGNMSYFVYHAAILANAGYTVVTFDYRGFGKSDDFKIQREYLYYNEFAWDLEAVVNVVSKKFEDKKIGVLGMSMGTTIISRAYYGDALALGNTLGENCTVVQFEGEHLAGFQVEYEQKGFGGWYVEQIDQFVKSLE